MSATSISVMEFSAGQLESPPTFLHTFKELGDERSPSRDHARTTPCQPNLAVPTRHNHKYNGIKRLSRCVLATRLLPLQRGLDSNVLDAQQGNCASRGGRICRSGAFWPWYLGQPCGSHAHGCCHST